jgi:hypothetical protein
MVVKISTAKTRRREDYQRLQGGGVGFDFCGALVSRTISAGRSGAVALVAPWRSRLSSLRCGRRKTSLKEPYARAPDRPAFLDWG